MDGGAGVVCAACAWFGVYRSDVAAQLAGCPNCGGNTLVTRDLADPAWHDLGREFVRTLPASALHAERPGGVSARHGAR